MLNAEDLGTMKHIQGYIKGIETVRDTIVFGANEKQRALARKE